MHRRQGDSGDRTAGDPGDRQRRLARLARMLVRIHKRTERDEELVRAMLEAERIGARRERERCASFLESLDCGDDGLELLLVEVARALRKRGLPDDH